MKHKKKAKISFHFSCFMNFVPNWPVEEVDEVRALEEKRAMKITKKWIRIHQRTVMVIEERTKLKALKIIFKYILTGCYLFRWVELSLFLVASRIHDQYPCRHHPKQSKQVIFTILIEGIANNIFFQKQCTIQIYNTFLFSKFGSTHRN